MHNQTHGFTENDFLKWFEAKTNGPLESRFHRGKHNSKGNFNFQMVCIRKIMINGYGWQRILSKYCKLRKKS